MYNVQKILLYICWTSLAIFTLFTGQSFRSSIDKGIRAEEFFRLNFRNTLATSSSEIPPEDYFLSLAYLLKRRYVEDIEIDNRLAFGAIKGMVNSLDDPYSKYMKPQEYRAYLKTKKGDFEGIGVELKIHYNSKQNTAFKNKKITDTAMLLPSLKVSAVLPGSPAEKAGIRVGDHIDSVDGKWVLTYNKIKLLRKLQKRAIKGKKETKKTKKLREKMSAKLKKSITPLKAYRLLSSGKEGKIKVGWFRKTKKFKKTIIKQQLSVQPVIEKGKNKIALRFLGNAEKDLSTYLEKNDPQNLIIDLRNSTIGDFFTMKQCMELLVPTGSYSQLTRKESGYSKPFAIVMGTKKKRKIQLLVDRSTRGAAEIFATLLKNHQFASVKGKNMIQDRVVIEDFELPDGSGYKIPTYHILKKAKKTSKMAGAKS